MNSPDLTRLPYPWHGLEDLVASAAGRLRLCVYGSLMNSGSAALTLDTNVRVPMRPAIVSGVKRIFNYRMPDSAFLRYGSPASRRHVAALNAVSTRDSANRFNGLLKDISAPDIPRLRQREFGYDLVGVSATDWSSGESIDALVYVLECPMVDETLLPHLEYLRVCHEGAREVSEGFAEYFVSSTFLADGTRLDAWLKEAAGDIR